MMAQDSVLQRLFDRISSPPISELLGKLKLDEGLLKTLKTNLQSLDAILDDAESKACLNGEGWWLYWQSRDRIVDHDGSDSHTEKNKYVRWLDDLKDVGYDLEDLLDKIATERLRHQFESKPWNIETYLDKIISPTVRDQLEEISSRIKLLLQRVKEELGLSDASWMMRKPYPLSAAKVHLEDDSQVYGRAEDKNAIIELLLPDNEDDDRVAVIPIVGEGGVGKSTLARLVYNDYRVSEHFDLKGWASFSKDVVFDRALTKAFSEAFSIEAFSIVDSRNIEDKLNKILNMKKFLLVLNDVPSYWCWNLEKVHTYLLKGAKGSKILLTTVAPTPPGGRTKWILPDYDLKPLNSDCSWMLFAKHAFADKEIGLHRGLEAIGKNIVTKCYGLPLLIVALGTMLRFKPSVEEWEALLRKLSDLVTKMGAVSILWVSYDSLPPNLKRCFAYCSIFPYDHEYDKEKLVLLWMAEGFLQHSKHRTIEEVGHEYFDELTFRSFFQKSDANSSRFVMHPLMHNLAQLVSGNFCFSFLNDPAGLPSRRVRHLSLSVKSYHQLICCNTSQLRTLLLYYLPPGERSTELSGWFLERAKNWRCLRVLSFSHNTITEWPHSIGALKLLQYLDLSHTEITRLPDIVTALYNLQTLLLSYCHLLSKLPKKFRRLVCLRHLDIRETCLKMMPAKMGCLTSLQSLSDFVVGKYSGSNIRELGSLKNLRGTLCISQLQNVTSASDASQANLKNKADLKVLELKWSDATANSQHATNVLEKLEPHRNLEKLSIISYNGMSFPDWVGDSSFSKMVFLHLSDCNSCPHLPPLGQLPSLRELIIEGMRGVKKIGPEFFRVNNVSANPFPSLEILVFQDMPEWKGWIASEMQPAVFPRLKRMCLKSCPKYDTNHLSLCLPPSAQVEISTDETVTVEKQLHKGDKVKDRGKELPEGSQEDISSPQQKSSNAKHGGASNNSLPAIGNREHDEDSQSSPEHESTNVSHLSQLESLPQMLCSLEIEACDALESLPADLNKLNNLQHLYIINCHLLKSIQVSRLPKKLKTLHIRKCKEVQFLSTAEKHKFLETLCIESSCDSLESFPLAIFPQLTMLSIWDCAKFNSLSITKDHKFLDALEIGDCTQFISFPEAELGIPNLTSILLSNCKNLKVLPGQLHGFTSLQSLFINECPEVELVPRGGLPSSLNLVCISICHKLTPCIEWGLRRLEHCSRIQIEDGSKDLESFPEQNLLPQNLISLQISRLPNLKILDYKGLKQVTSLKTLEINSCNKLHSLPDEGLPSSLSYLYISDCPLLNSELRKRSGNEWLKIAHIPDIQIDGKVIS